MKRPSQIRAARRAQRGQAMVEYSSVTIALFGGLVAAGWPFFNMLIEALDKYYASIYYLIQSPIP